MANYAQAIEQNKISSIITFTEEFLFAVVGALILTRVIGGIGIWVSIIFAECIPVFIYLAYSIRLQKSYKNKLSTFLLLQNSRLVAWTYNRSDVGKVDKYLDEESGEVLHCIERCFRDDSIVISNSINDICNTLFETSKDIDDIDITIRLIEDELYIALTSQGKLCNPFSSKKLMESENIKKLTEMGCKLDYDELLGFNKTYILFEN